MPKNLMSLLWVDHETFDRHRGPAGMLSTAPMSRGSKNESAVDPAGFDGKLASEDIERYGTLGKLST